jgi:hypothetical protein
VGAGCVGFGFVLVFAVGVDADYGGLFDVTFFAEEVPAGAIGLDIDLVSM